MRTKLPPNRSRRLEYRLALQVPGGRIQGPVQGQGRIQLPGLEAEVEAGVAVELVVELQHRPTRPLPAPRANFLSGRDGLPWFVGLSDC